MHDEDRIRSHIQAAGARAEPETRRLTAHIVGHCWPGGEHDRSEPAALAWVKRWRPATLGMRMPACSCADGRCLVCN